MKRYSEHGIPWAPLLVLLIAVMESRAQTIETLPLERTTLCADDSITVRFRATGDTWKTFNEFVVEVSLPDGTFGSGTRKIGSLLSIAPEEVEEVGAVIPDDLDPSGRYRIRVSSTRPTVSGTDNGQDVRIVPLVTAQFGLPAMFWITGQAMVITSYISGAAQVEWDFGEGAIPASSDQLKPPTIRYQSPGHKSIRLTTTNDAGCPRTLTTTFNVYENHPRIPARTSIGVSPYTDPEGNPGKSAHAWICPGDSLIFWGGDGGGVLRLYIESEGTVVILDTYSEIIAYVKRRGNLIIQSPGRISVIHEDQAFLDLQFPLHTLHVEADSIGFDYSEAPANGCRPESDVVDVDTRSWTEGNIVRISVRSDGGILEGRMVDAGTGIRDVTLYDIRGERLLRQDVGAEGFILPLPDLPPGPYLVVINSTAGIVHRRIILTR